MSSRPADSHRWRSYHVYYHGGLNPLLTGAIRGAVASLLSEGRIDNFFFIRYELGGPHLRVRVRIVGDEEDRVAEHLRSAAEAFFARRPSPESRPVEEILATNRTIVPTDPGADAEAVFPDHSFHVVPFRPETERYGDGELLRRSLDFFALSSLQALRYVSAHGEEPQARQLAQMLRILARQAWGLADTREEMLTLAEYPAVYWGAVVNPVVERGDRMFEQQRDMFLTLVEHDIGRLAESASHSPTLEPGSLLFDLQAARRFSREIGRPEKPTRLGIETSQMHMTANRLGVNTLDEVYLGRLLGRTIRALMESKPGVWRRLWERTRERTRLDAEDKGRLERLHAEALADFARRAPMWM